MKASRTHTCYMARHFLWVSDTQPVCTKQVTSCKWCAVCHATQRSPSHRLIPETSCQTAC